MSYYAAGYVQGKGKDFVLFGSEYTPSHDTLLHIAYIPTYFRKEPNRNGYYGQVSQRSDGYPVI